MNLQEQKERLDLLGAYQKQQESMRERLQGMDIGKTLIPRKILPNRRSGSWMT